MHVLQITPRYPPNLGGVETVVEKISELLVAEGTQVTVYSADLRSGLSKRQEINGVLVKRFTPLFSDPLYLPEPRFVRNLRQENADILHAHNAHVLTPFIATLSKHGGQRFLLQPYYHGLGQSRLRHSLLRLYRVWLNSVVLPRTDLVVANSTYEKTIFRKDFSACRKLITIPLGMNVCEINRVRRNPEEPKRILYIGALKAYKNVDKILEGFARLTQTRKNEFRLVIVGQGPQHEQLANLANRLGVASSVEWRKRLSREQLLDEYSRATVFILLSQLESFSLVVYEALMIGVPTVVLNYGPLADLVRDGLAEGVNSLGSDAVADAISAATQKKYPRMAEGENFLDWKDYAHKILSVYSELL